MSGVCERVSVGVQTQMPVGVKPQLCRAPGGMALEVWGMSEKWAVSGVWGGGVVNKKGRGVRCARTDREGSDSAGRVPREHRMRGAGMGGFNLSLPL